MEEVTLVNAEHLHQMRSRQSGMTADEGIQVCLSKDVSKKFSIEALKIWTEDIHEDGLVYTRSYPSPDRRQKFYWLSVAIFTGTRTEPGQTSFKFLKRLYIIRKKMLVLKCIVGIVGRTDTLASVWPIRQYKQSFWNGIKAVMRPLLTQYICVFWFVSVLLVTSRFAVLKKPSVCLSKPMLSLTSSLYLVRNFRKSRLSRMQISSLFNLYNWNTPYSIRLCLQIAAPRSIGYLFFYHHKWTALDLIVSVSSWLYLIGTIVCWILGEGSREKQKGENSTDIYIRA